MAGEQLSFPFPQVVADEVDEPVTEEVYVAILEARSVREVSAAFRGPRIASRSAEQSEPARKRA